MKHFQNYLETFSKLHGNISKTTWKHFQNYLEILSRSKQFLVVLEILTIFPGSFENSSNKHLW
jgi:hypothetical protein